MATYRREGRLWVPECRAETAERERLARYATITAGVYAWQADTPGKCEEAGSAVLVAPGLALTAKHVINSMGRLDPR